MTSEGLWEMFEGDSADTRAGKLPLVPMGLSVQIRRWGGTRRPPMGGDPWGGTEARWGGIRA